MTKQTFVGVLMRCSHNSIRVHQLKRGWRPFHNPGNGPGEKSLKQQWATYNLQTERKGSKWRKWADVTQVSNISACSRPYQSGWRWQELWYQVSIHQVKKKVSKKELLMTSVSDDKGSPEFKNSWKTWETWGADIVGQRLFIYFM